jgi:hypothetical protein
MRRNLYLLFVSAFFSVTAFSQADFEKKAHLSAGIGFGSGTENIKKVGLTTWIQLNYQVSKNFSVATEFENLDFTQPGFYENLPVDPNEMQVVDNSFSLLVKYHMPIKSRFAVRLASGWSYMTRQSKYYIYENDGTNERWFQNVFSFSDYRIPFILEIEYPLSGSIGIQARVKYNVSSGNNDTYSGGMGVSGKL